MAKKISFGIIGCSKVATKFIPALISSKFAKLDIIGSRYLEKAREYARKYGCSKFGDYYDIIESDADAVYISLPVGLHEKWVKIAAEAGKHIICEKSSTTSFKSAKRMVEVCKKNNARILEGLMFKFHPQNKMSKDLVKNGTIGKQLAFFGNYWLPNPSENNIRMKKNLGGGVLNDAGCYPVSTSRLVFDSEPVEAASRLVFDSQKGVDRHAYAYLKFSKNRIALVNVGYGLAYSSNYSVLGTRGSLTLRKAFSVPKDYKPEIIFKSGHIVKTFRPKPADQFRLMIDHFCREIGTKKKKDDFESDLLKQAKAMEMIRLSAARKEPVHAKDVK